VAFGSSLKKNREGSEKIFCKENQQQLQENIKFSINLIKIIAIINLTRSLNKSGLLYALPDFGAPFQGEHF